MPIISVVVPVYNVEPYIRRCVDSILAQTFSDFELILVDDGSPDGCPAICDAYARQDSRVRVIHQKNGGLSAARNAGIDWTLSNSSSEWITFIDSDDSICDCYLELMYRAVCEKDVDMCVCGNSVTKEEHPQIDSTRVEAQKISVEKLYSLEVTGLNLISAWGKLYRKELWKDIRYPVGKIMEDRFTTHKLIFQCVDVVIIRDSLYFYYLNANSIMRSPWTPKKLDDVQAAHEQFEYFQKRNLNKAIEKNMVSYFWMISIMLEDLNKVSPQYDQYRTFLRNDARKILRKYRKIVNYSLPKDAWIYEITHPLLMKLYWRLQTLLKKLGI